MRLTAACTVRSIQLPMPGLEWTRQHAAVELLKLGHKHTTPYNSRCKATVTDHFMCPSLTATADGGVATALTSEGHTIVQPALPQQLPYTSPGAEPDITLSPCSPHVPLVAQIACKSNYAVSSSTNNRTDGHDHKMHHSSVCAAHKFDSSQPLAASRHCG
jgi:hypothetical protein